MWLDKQKWRICYRSHGRACLENWTTVLHSVCLRLVCTPGHMLYTVHLLEPAKSEAVLLSQPRVHKGMHSLFYIMEMQCIVRHVLLIIRCLKCKKKREKKSCWSWLNRLPVLITGSLLCYLVWIWYRSRTVVFTEAWPAMPLSLLHACQEWGVIPQTSITALYGVSILLRHRASTTCTFPPAYLLTAAGTLTVVQ